MENNPWGSNRIVLIAKDVHLMVSNKMLGQLGNAPLDPADLVVKIDDEGDFHDVTWLLAEALLAKDVSTSQEKKRASPRRIHGGFWQ